MFEIINFQSVKISKTETCAPLGPPSCFLPDSEAGDLGDGEDEAVSCVLMGRDRVGGGKG